MSELEAVLDSLDEYERREWQVKRYEHWEHTAFLSSVLFNLLKADGVAPLKPTDFIPEGVTLPWKDSESNPQDQPQQSQKWEKLYNMIKDKNDQYKKAKGL